MDRPRLVQITLSKDSRGFFIELPADGARKFFLPDDALPEGLSSEDLETIDAWRSNWRRIDFRDAEAQAGEEGHG